MNNFGLNGVQWSDVKAVSVNPVKPYDAEVEYLQSVSGSYITTNYYPTSNFGFVADAYIPNGSWLFIFGNNYNTNTMGLFGVTSGSNLVFRTPGQNNNIIGCANQKIHITYSNGVATVGNTNYQIASYSSSPDFPLKIFNGTGVKLYQIQFYELGNLVHEYVPVRVGTTGYLLDKVSGQLFGNQGTGAFLYGSDVRCYSVAKIEQGSTTLWKKRPYDAEVEYLESTGTQYIETGLYLQSNDTVSMRAEAPSSVNEALWSARNLGQQPWITFTLFRLGGTNKGRFDYGKFTSSSTDINTNFDFSGWSGVHEYKAVANKLYIDDTLYATGKADQFTTGGPARLLASERAGTSGTITNFFVGKMYGFKVIRNGATILELIPVRVGTTGYFFDRISWTLFGNAGTGVFGYGADL